MDSDQEKLNRAFYQASKDKDETKLLLSIKEIAESSKLSQKNFDLVMTRAVIGRIEKGNLGIHIAANLGFNFVVKLMVESGISVDFPNMSGRTPLHFAVVNKGKNSVKTLLDLGAKINSQNSRNETPLDIAIKFKNQDTIDFLKGRGALTGEELNYSPARTVNLPSSDPSNQKRQVPYNWLGR